MPLNRDEENRTATFVRLLTQCERRVYAVILSLVPNLADVDEILQETNIRLWRDFDQYVPGTDFYAWAVTIARYQVMTYRKKMGRERMIFTDALIEKMTDEALSMMSDERHQALLRCVETLPDKSRRLLWSYYAHHADRAKIAAEQGRSVNSLHHALSRIRKLLHDCINRRLDRPA